MMKRGNFLCAGYASMRGYASKLWSRVPVFAVFCRGAWMIERGNFLCAATHPRVATGQNSKIVESNSGCVFSQYLLLQSK